MRLKDKVAIITGGSRGIGFATADHFLREGATVILAASTQDSADKAVERLREKHPGAVVAGISPDLASLESVRKAFAAATEQYGCVDILVNNAGISESTPFMEYTEDTFDKVMDLNVKGVFNEANMKEESPEFGALRSYLVSKLMWDPDMTREEYDRAIHEFIAAYYGEAADVVEEYFYMMSAFAHDRHFEQYAGANGIIDMNQFTQTVGEVSDWMDALNDFEYERSESKTHMNRLRKGFSQIQRFAINLK